VELKSDLDEHLASISAVMMLFRLSRLKKNRLQRPTVAGSRLWNSLLPDVTSASTLTVFRNRLKTFLFPIISFLTVFGF